MNGLTLMSSFSAMALFAYAKVIVYFCVDSISAILPNSLMSFSSICGSFYSPIQRSCH